MAEDTGASDPSMEEILASIRKIISDDAPPAEAAPAASTPAAEPEAGIATPTAKEDDILELTQMVQDDGSVVDLADIEPEPAPPPPPPPPPPVMMPPVMMPPVMMPTEALISQPAAQSAATALSALANTVEIERLASAPFGATALGNGGRTLEDMVIELMRPMLKSWLDQNLPPIVDKLVQKEIERISRRA
jgi:cell pole-organizing protein PopZ